MAQWLGCLPLRPALTDVEFDHGSSWFDFPAALVNSQLPPANWDSYNSCCCRCSVPSFRCVSLALKSPYGKWSINLKEIKEIS